MELTNNWVKERAACDIEQTFTDLRARVQQDLDVWNELSNANGRAKISSSGGREFTVLNERNIGGFPDRRGVFIRRTQGEIVAMAIKTDPVGQPQRFTLLTATPVLTEKGERRLTVVAERPYDEPLELWQVSRLVLEDLLFGEE